MKTLCPALLVVLATFLPGARADAPAVRVAAGVELRLGIVDPGKPGATRDALHRAFAESLGGALSEACGEKIGIKVRAISADNAAFGLGGGALDAVLVLANALPRPLIMSDTSRLSATLGADKDERKAFLVFNKVDEGLDKLLRETFAPALGSQQFLDLLDGGIDPNADPGKGTKLAANGK